MNNNIFDEIKEANTQAMVSLLMGDYLKAIGFMKDQSDLFNTLNRRWENNND